MKFHERIIGHIESEMADAGYEITVDFRHANTGYVRGFRGGSLTPSTEIEFNFQDTYFTLNNGEDSTYVSISEDDVQKAVDALIGRSL